MSEFLQISFDLGELPADGAEAACFECGASAITFADARDEPVLEPAPGELRLWPATRLEALFTPDAPQEALIARLSAALGVAPERLTARRLADRVWEREWLRDFHAMRFGLRLWICPQHEQVEDPDAVVVRLDPGLAFGTGTHPTTALCLEWLDAHPPIDGEVVDYGCGSGVLALAAARLGARRVQCFDIDPQALLATHENAAANGLERQIRPCAAAEALEPPVALLMANILCAPLVALAPRFAALVATDGAVLLAGLLEPDADEVIAAYAPWFALKPVATREGWVALSGRRRAEGPI
ncbi:MAG: 50S ribosomal protein L11 methyltransferase [Pseudomonadota bacterium]|jgi:ribosomal protein L11 methyltransferase|nr:50S ribosomal protein L11 methyltransferase [Pseudomonadota bacterium]